MNLGSLVRGFGSTMLRGVRYADWRPHLDANRGDISPEYRFRAAATTAISRANSALGVLEDRYLPEVRGTAVEPPVFILGQPRSGTTFLQQLFAADEHFAFPNIFQTHFPNSFLTTERYLSPLLNGRFQGTNRGIDNVTEDFQSPGEDDWAICNVCCLSPNMSFVFPNRAEYYDRYLSFRDVSADEIDRWKAALMLFAQKLTWKYKKPLVLKSPVNTCRIKLLLDLFPQAKFIHIHRHPLDVFSSLQRLMEMFYERAQLSNFQADKLAQRVIWQYRHIFDVFYDEKTQIRPGHFVEIGYDELAKNPLAALEKIYSKLGLTHFEQFRPRAQQVCDQRRDYKRNKFPDLSPDLRRRLVEAWEPCFDAWGYDKSYPLHSQSTSAGQPSAAASPNEAVAE